ncbi:MAG: LamG domain-containing protein [Cytophagaceae bacterium]|nr:MAG: LamG domain-containing protein [Cytophagaceae bacterium]
MGNALHYRGPSTEDYVTVANYPKPTNSISFSGWVNADTNTVTWQSIVKNWGSGSIGQFHLGLDNDSQTLSLYMTQADGSVVSVLDSAQLPTNQWVQVGFVADAGSNTVSLYRDGAVVGTTSYDGTLLNPPMSSMGFGIKTDDTGTVPDSSVPGFWQGSFDDFAFWDRAVTSTEMAQIHTNGLAGSGVGAAVVPEQNSIALFGLSIPALGMLIARRRGHTLRA